MLTAFVKCILTYHLTTHAKVCNFPNASEVHTFSAEKNWKEHRKCYLSLTVSAIGGKWGVWKSKEFDVDYLRPHLKWLFSHTPITSAMFLPFSTIEAHSSEHNGHASQANYSHVSYRGAVFPLWECAFWIGKAPSLVSGSFH